MGPELAEPGAVLGEMAVILGRPHSADVWAAAPSRCHVLEDAARLLWSEPDLALYVKTDAAALPPAPGHPRLVRFELVVKDVLADRAEGAEAGSFLVSGVTFAWPGGPEAWTRHWARMRDALRA